MMAKESGAPCSDELLCSCRTASSSLVSTCLRKLWASAALVSPKVSGSANAGSSAVFATTPAKYDSERSEKQSQYLESQGAF